MKNLLILLFLYPLSLTAQEKGNAGVYSSELNGRKTANGQTYNMNKFTASHKMIEFGTWIRVRNISTGATVEVIINDRGPYTGNRIIDLSTKAARKIGIKPNETQAVEIEILGKNYQPKVETSSVMPVFKERAKQNQKALKAKSKKALKPPTYTPNNHKPLTKNKPITSTLLCLNLSPVANIGYAVQIGIFSNFENIYLQVSRLNTQQQQNIIIKPVNIKGKTKYKMLLGPYKSMSKAKAAQGKIKRLVKDCIVVDLTIL